MYQNIFHVSYCEEKLLACRYVSCNMPTSVRDNLGRGKIEEKMKLVYVGQEDSKQVPNVLARPRRVSGKHYAFM